MRQHKRWSPNRRKAKECNLGPPPTLEPDLEYFLGELTVVRGAEGGVQPVRRALCGELWGLARMERLPDRHTWLVGEVGSHASWRQPLQTRPEGTSFLQDSMGEMQGSKRQQWLFFATLPQNALVGRHSRQFQISGLSSGSSPGAAQLNGDTPLPPSDPSGASLFKFRQLKVAPPESAVPVGGGPDVVVWKNKGSVDRGTPVQSHHVSHLCLTPLRKVHQKCHHPASGRLPHLWQEINTHELPSSPLRSWCHLISW